MERPVAADSRGQLLPLLDWLELYWRHFGGDQRLRALVVRADRQPVGILPLVVQKEQTRVGNVRTLTYPLHDWGTFYGPIGPNPTATLLAGLRHIARTRRDWDMLDLRWINVDGCDRGRSERTMEQVGFRPQAQVWDVAPRIEIDGAWAGLLERAGEEMAAQRRAMRATAARERRGLVHSLSSPRAACGDGDPRWDLYDECVELAARSWQSGGGETATLSSPGVRQFLREVHAAAARSGNVDLSLLRLDGRPVAFVYNYIYDGRIYGLRKGFDPEFSTLRPGTTLEKMMLEDGFRRDDRLYDLGVGSLEIKAPWQTSVATSYRLTHFPAAISRVQLLRLKRWLSGKGILPGARSIGWRRRRRHLWAVDLGCRPSSLTRPASSLPPLWVREICVSRRYPDSASCLSSPPPATSRMERGTVQAPGCNGVDSTQDGRYNDMLAMQIFCFRSVGPL